MPLHYCNDLFQDFRNQSFFRDDFQKTRLRIKNILEYRQCHFISLVSGSASEDGQPWWSVADWQDLNTRRIPKTLLFCQVLYGLPDGHDFALIELVFCEILFGVNQSGNDCQWRRTLDLPDSY